MTLSRREQRNHQERAEPLILTINWQKIEFRGARGDPKQNAFFLVSPSGTAMLAAPRAATPSPGAAGRLWVNAGPEQVCRLVMEGWEVENEVPLLV